MQNVKRFGAIALIAAAGTAAAQPALDGSIVGDEATYGPALWTNTTPTQFGNATPPAPCTEDVSDAANVVTGAEMSIPLSEIGNPAGPIQITVLLVSGGWDFIGNQVSGGVGGAIDGPNVGDPRGADLNTVLGIQTLTVSAVATTAPTIDGVNDGAAAYGPALFVQDTATRFGDQDNSDPAFGLGAEINSIYASTDATNLYIHIAGNLSDDFGNQFHVYIDSVAGGQNQLRGDNADISFDRLNRMGNSEEGVTTDGLIFETGFEADYVYAITAGGGDLEADPIDPTDLFVDFASLPTLGGGTGAFLGQGDMGTGAVSVSAPEGEFAFDNSNILGVTEVCPPPSGDPTFSNGSELNQLFGYIDENTNQMYLLLTGNIETSAGNRVNFLFDVAPGGQGNSFPLSDFNVDIDFNALNRIGSGDAGDPPVFTDGVILERDADYWASYKTFDTANPQQFGHAAVLRTSGFPLSNGLGFPFDFGAFSGGNFAGTPIITFDGPRLDDGQTSTTQIANLFTEYAPRTATDNTYGPLIDPVNFPSVLPPEGNLINMVIDNSNIDGVSDTDGTTAATATTGIELVFDMDELGWDGTSEVALMGWLASADNGFISNQVIGGLDSSFDTVNVGEVRGTDFTAIAGDQFVIIPLGSSAGGCVTDFTGPAQDGIPDKTVDSADLTLFLDEYVAQFGTAGGTGPNGFSADLTGPAQDGVPDQTVDSADLTFFLDNYSAEFGQPCN
jgi:hypothetical protein